MIIEYTLKVSGAGATYSFSTFSSSQIATELSKWSDKFVNVIYNTATKGGEKALGRMATEAVKGLRWVIANQSFYGFPPMYFSGKMWLQTSAVPSGRNRWHVVTTEYGAKLTEGLPPGTIVPATGYTIAWAREKMKAPFSVMQRTIMKKGVKPRNWVELGIQMAYPDMLLGVYEEIERVLRREIQKAIGGG